MTTMRSTKYYGWKPQLGDKRDFKLVHPANKIASRPSSFDLTPKMPPVWDQGDLGSCTGNASAAAFEYIAMQQGATFGTPSRLFIYLNARQIEGDVSTDAGAQVRDAVKGMVSYGVVSETEWPYDPTQFATIPNTNVYADAKKAVVSSYLAVNQTVDDFCTTLADGDPIVFGFTVYSAFESDAVAQSGVLNLPDLNSETVVGGHCVLMVGYDDATQCFKIRNSWGSTWGQAGYFTMPYAYATDPDLASDFWVVRADSILV